jgi:hypothetical protein
MARAIRWQYPTAKEHPLEGKKKKEKPLTNRQRHVVIIVI